MRHPFPHYYVSFKLWNSDLWAYYISALRSIIFHQNKPKIDTVNKRASKILALLPELMLPIFIHSLNKHLPSINLNNYLGLVLCCVLNSTNASHDGPQYALLYRTLTGHLKTGNLITQCLSSAYGNRNRVSRMLRMKESNLYVYHQHIYSYE